MRCQYQPVPVDEAGIVRHSVTRLDGGVAFDSVEFQPQRGFEPNVLVFFRRVFPWSKEVLVTWQQAAISLKPVGSFVKISRLVI